MQIQADSKIFTCKQQYIERLQLAPAFFQHTLKLKL